MGTDASTGLSFNLFLRRVRHMINAIMAARMTAPDDETPVISAICLDESDAGNAGLVNAIGGPPAHSQYPISFWYAIPAD